MFLSSTKTRWILFGSLLVAAVPAMLIIAYGVARVFAQAFGELRDFYSRSWQNAQRVNCTQYV